MLDCFIQPFRPREVRFENIYSILITKNFNKKFKKQNTEKLENFI